MNAAALRARWRWAIVTCGAGLLCATPAIVAAVPVPGSALAPAALRARILASAAVGYQGYAESTADLGLPKLPDLGDVSTLLDGVTDQYVWYRSAAHWRADTLTTAGEDDVYQVGRETFLWNYTANLLTRVVGSQPVRLPRAADLLPPALATRLLRLAAPDDHLSRLPSARVAGVDAAGLRLVPANPATTVGAIDIWADPASGLPVEVEILARGAGQPVLVAKFLQVSQHRPALATVIPHPAPGVDQVTARLSSLNGILNGGRAHPWPPELGGFRLTFTTGLLTGVAFYGSGFARLALVPLPGRTGSQVVSAATSAGAAKITLPGGSAVLVRTPLLTVVLATSPRFGGLTFLFAGPVTAAALEQAAGGLLALIAGAR
ncbi:MAG: hypothetical protein ACRDNF_21160 [Streptosporangiaceae bacterium]